jgi:hypothetical protein
MSDTLVAMTPSHITASPLDGNGVEDECTATTTPSILYRTLYGTISAPSNYSTSTNEASSVATASPESSAGWAST